MTTPRTVLTGSLRLLRVIAEEEEPTAVALQDGLELFNQFMHSLKSNNVDLDWSDLTLDDDIPVPPEHILPVKYMVTAHLAAEWGSQLTPEVAVFANDGWPTLRAYYRRVARLRVDPGIHDRNRRYTYDITQDE